MPSVSKSQQRLMGVAYAVKSGDMELSDVDPAYRDKVKSLSDGMTKKDLKKYASTKHDELPETVDEAFIGPFVFNDSMSDEELLGMYNGALDGYANYAKGMHYSKSDYKKAYQEIEKILKKRGVSVDENAMGAISLNPGMTIGGMGPVVLPSDGGVGSGDVPSVADIDDDEEEAKKDKTKKKLEMEGFKLFTQFSNFINEGLAESDKVYEEAILENAVRDLHFETDPKRAEELKIEIGASQGEVTRRKQIEGGEYSLRRFRKEIKYDETGEDLGVFKPGSYMAATSTLGDGPHKKVVKKRRWNQKMYNQWIEDVASNGGWEHAFDMAQNAKHEHGLIDWVKKNYRDDDPMQRIQWDIEAFAESVVTEAQIRVHSWFGQRKEFRDWLKKHKVEVVSAEGEDGKDTIELVLTGKTKDLKKILKSDHKFGWDDKQMWAYIEEAEVNEKKLGRDDMIKWIEKYMDFVSTTEKFNGSQGGIWVSGEAGDEFKGRVIYAYYSEDYKNRTFGVDNRWEKELNKRGWYSEWHDAGTSMIWPL